MFEDEFRLKKPVFQMMDNFLGWRQQLYGDKSPTFKAKLMKSRLPFLGTPKRSDEQRRVQTEWDFCSGELLNLICRLFEYPLFFQEKVVYLRKSGLWSRTSRRDKVSRSGLS